MEVRRAVFDKYNDRLDAAKKKLIWECDGSGYLVNEHSRQVVNTHWTTVEYHPVIMKPDFDDFMIK